MKVFFFSDLLIKCICWMNCLEPMLGTGQKIMPALIPVFWRAWHSESWKIKSPNKQWLCLKCMIIFLYFDVYVDMGLWDDTRENQCKNHIKGCLVLVCDKHWFPCTQNSMFLTVLTLKMKTQFIDNEIHKQCKVVYLFP